MDKVDAALTRKINEKFDDPVVKEILKGIYPHDDDDDDEDED